MNASGPDIVLEVFALTDAGPFRPHNEDVVLARPDIGLFVVADGLGGRPLGERAAELTAERFAELCTEVPSERALLEAFRRVNDALHAESLARGLAQPMAAVATVAWIDRGDRPGRMLIGHIGDTRAHLFDAGGAGCQLTRDQGAVDADAVPESEALSAPGRNVVERALGLHAWTSQECEANVELRELILEPDCTLVLVSDGITDYLDRARTAAIAAEHSDSAEDLAQALIKAALEAQQGAGAGDNVSVVVVRRKRAARASIAFGALLARPSPRILGALAAGAVIGLLTGGALRAADGPPAQQKSQPSDPHTFELASRDGRPLGPHTFELPSRDGCPLGPVVITIAGGASLTIANGSVSIDAADVRIVVDDGARREEPAPEPSPPRPSAHDATRKGAQ